MILSKKGIIGAKKIIFIFLGLLHEILRFVDEINNIGY